MSRTLVLAAAVFAVVLLSRAPFAAQTLWAHDSVLYANAIERGFHVDDALVDQRPHPPGYILYVASAGLGRAAGLDSNSALVLVSIVASALSAAALFLLLRRWTANVVALIAAASFATNPLVWQYSEIAYPYTVLGLASIAVAAASLWARGHGLRRALIASAALGIAAGFRQDLLVLALPLWIWTIWPLGVRRAAYAAAGVAVSMMVWLVPTVVLSGGPLEYFDALRSQADYVGATYSIEARGLPAFAANAGSTLWALGWGTFAIAPLLLIPVVALARRGRRSAGADGVAFLALWVLPPIAVYVTLHIGDWGYVLSTLPGLYVVAARGLDALLSRRPAARRAVVPAAWAAAVVFPALFFVLSTAPFSAATIATHDAELSTRVRYVRDNYAPRNTLILTREDFLLVRYYLPEYHARQYDPEPYVRSWRRMRIGRVERVVVFTPGLVPEVARDVRRVECAKGKGIQLVYADVVPGAILEFRGERYAIASPSP
ncbi:MAG: hypothetical protein M3R54_06385 [Chloroflexota bacterium]|nr:hypothetical protein [Chloroflexota bacterium]